MYPGDPDFQLGTYADLPYHYVLAAFAKGQELVREDLHNIERPIAMVSSLLANKDRDPKKNKKGYSYEDFSFYKPSGGVNGPEDYYGSAMLHLAKTNQLPPWALFCFKEVAGNADPSYVPELPALIAHDAMLLHPTKTPAGWSGMLIALESASTQQRVFKGTGGEEVVLTVPHIHTKVIAEEGITLLR